jgi:YidC/Oxa1 family membrane protein insertase
VLQLIGNLFQALFTQPIFNVLMLLDHLFGDLGLSIIVLTIIIRLLLFPLYRRQLRSSKAMQAIQPLIADVRKKYKDQREQYQAMQAIYKEYGVSPAAGCLPLVIQLPILYGLFFALNTVLHATGLAGLHTINSLIYPFLPKFTTLPSVYLDWFGLHLNLGAPDPSHILPILAALATFVQLRMSQPRTVAGSKDTMSQQMQIMQYIMPVVTLFFAWTFAAGLALYWTTSTIFTIVQQYFVTGWGSLTVMPTFLEGLFNRSGGGKSNGGNKSSTGDQRKELRQLEKGNQPQTGTVSTNGRSERSSQSSANADGSSSARRRSRGGSASARRRGNTPKKNVSRS